MLRLNLIEIKIGLNNGLGVHEIEAKTGFNTYKINSLISQSYKYDLDRLYELLELAVQIDFNLKAGGMGMDFAKSQLGLLCASVLV